MNRHLSPEEISGWIVGERPADAERHARHCAECRGEIDRINGAVGLFRDWYAAGLPAAPAPAATPRRTVLIGALAASLAAGVLLTPRPSAIRGDSFVPIPYVAPLAPYERASMVRMDVPVAALIAAGFEVRVPDAGVSLPADVLIGQDGRPYAIRPVTSSNQDRRTDQ
jgi:hypothetical protein